MELNIAVLPGDGIGPEIVNEALKVTKTVCEKFGHELSYKHALVGACAIDKTGNPYPDETHELCMQSDAVLFGAIGDPKYDNNPSAKVRPEQGLLGMRKKLGLYANIRPVSTFDSLIYKSPLRADIVKDTDLMCIRELTGGIYFGRPQGRSEDGTIAYDTCVYSREEIEKQYPEITTEYMFVDNAAMQLIQWPNRFDVIVTENMFGDILTDEASVITGSLGMLPSASIGVHTSVFEPIHGSYPQAAGKNIANPVATILSAALMFEYAFNLMDEGKMIREAVDASIEAGIVTEDLAQNGKSYKTSEVGQWIADYIKNK